jgi:ribosomal protein S18 acetylase RimI-like enzyme
MAWVGNEAAGCCAFRPCPDADHVNACEMKRLYVPHAFRGLGVGRLLVEAVLQAARLNGYSCVLLDTLHEMEAARSLYEDMGFVEIPPYVQTPLPGAHHLKVVL